MKKVIAFVAVLFCLSATTAMAQGGGQQMDPAARLAAQKERFKALGLNDVQVDSVIAISNDARAVMQGVNFRDLTDDQRAAKMKEMSDFRQKRLEKALPADLAKKVVEAMNQQRPGGGRPGGGGK
jgi:hypothetical protein